LLLRFPVVHCLRKAVALKTGLLLWVVSRHDHCPVLRNETSNSDFQLASTVIIGVQRRNDTVKPCETAGSIFR
jgi:hypothetical protein